MSDINTPLDALIIPSLDQTKLELNALPDPSVWLHHYRRAMDTYADKDGAATILEETRKSALYRVALLLYNEPSDSKKPSWVAAEAEAHSDEMYTNHIVAMSQARVAANHARNQAKQIEMFLDQLQTAQVTLRQEAKYVSAR